MVNTELFKLFYLNEEEAYGLVNEYAEGRRG